MKKQGEDKNSQLRARSQEELAARGAGLLELVAVLREVGVPYFLAEGTLLGAVREGAFIQWDWDVGIHLLDESASFRLVQIEENLLKAKFQVSRGDSRSPKINAYKYAEKYELTVWRLQGKMRVRRGRRIPNRFYLEPGEIDFLGHVFPCPEPRDEFLEHCYGDWRTPVRSTESVTDKSLSIWRIATRTIRRRCSR